MIFEDKIVSLVSNDKQEDKIIEKSLRPKSLSEYIGQKTTVEQLNLFIKAAKLRNDVLDHVLIFGPPGLGKTTLANIIAFEMQGNLKITSGPAIEKIKDLGAILTNLNLGDILFIDEIHRLNVSIEETLYNAMEDFKFDIIMGEGPAARNIRIDIEPFTLVGATTRAGMLTKPLFDRFGIVQKLQFYDISDLAKITFDNAFKLKTEINKQGALAIAKRARGTPRIANMLLKRVRDYAQVHNANYISEEIANDALNMLGIDETGLDLQDKNYLQVLLDIYKGGPAGIESIAASLSEDVRTLEDVVEPYLMQQGYITRTVRGRIATDKTYQQFGYKRES